jgi:hypothetical protein
MATPWVRVSFLSLQANGLLQTLAMIGLDDSNQ